MSTASSPASRRALLIGIDRYPKFPAAAQLAGCVNDVQAVADLLVRRFSFPAANVERLLDGAATQKGIRAALSGLAERAGAGDVVVVHYSGHGSRMADPTAPDGWDETIVPCDSGRAPHPNRDICDQELHRWLLRLTERCAQLTLIFDSCHSGHVLRDPFGSRGRWVEADPRPAAEPASAQGATADGSPRRGWRDAELGGDDGLPPLGGKYVLVAGCRSDETSFEVPAAAAGEVQHGALSYFLCQELAKAGAATSFRDLFEVVAPQVTARYPSQHPQLEGARDVAVFGVSELEPMRFVPARRDGAGKLILAAGAACGMTVGSQWGIYPPGTKSIAAGALPLARVEVKQVRALDSEGRLLEGEVGPAGGRAVEEIHRYGDTRFAVEIDAGAARQAAAAAALRSGIEASAMLGLHDGKGTAVARVYLLPARGAVTGAGGAVPAAGALTADSWAVVGEDGELLMPVHAAAEPRIVDLLLENLEKRARFRAAMELADPGGPLSGKVQLAILGRDGERWVEWGSAETRERAKRGEAGNQQRRKASRSGLPAAPVAPVAATEPVFQAGEQIAFRVTHSHPSPLYFYLLDFGLSGAVSLVYPATGGEQKAEPGDRALLVGEGEAETITLCLPKGFPFGGDPAARPAGWVETVRLFATTAEADFSVLEQRAVRGAEPAGHESPLGRLLMASVTRHGMREMQVSRPVAAGDWTVVQRSFRLLP